MKTSVKKLLSMLLVLAMVLGMVPAVMADGEFVEVNNSEAFCTNIEAGNNIKLIGSFTLGAQATVSAGATVTLNLNGQTITSAKAGSNFIEVAVGGTLTVMDSAGGGGMTSSATTSASRCIRNYGTLTVEGGTFTVTSQRNTYAIYSEGGDVTITGGSFTGTNTSATANHAAGLGLKNSTAHISGDPVFTGSSKNTNTGSLVAAIIATGGSSTITIEGGSFTGNRTDGSTVAASAISCVSGATASATIGGLAGICENGKVEFSETYGALEIAGTNKTTGLIFGQAKNLTLYTVSFLGEKNEVDGKLFTNYFGTDEEVTYQVINVRDNTPNPLPENVQKLRDRVVEEMYAMAIIEWYTSEDLYHDCACLLSICHGIFEAGKLHVGVPYNHKGGSLARFQYCLTDDNTVDDWVYAFESYDGYDMYMGNDCSSAIQQSWWTVSNSTNLIRCTYMHPKYMEQNGCIPVGEWNWVEGIDEKGKKYTDNYTKPYADASGSEAMYEAYALLRKGDAYSSLKKDGGHTRMVLEDPVIVRDENGNINGKYSYVPSIEQGGPNVTEPYYCSWNVGKQYTFQQLFDGGYLPVTYEELLTGEMEPVEVTIIGDVDGKLGMVCGEIKSNYYLDGTELVITNSKGEEVLRHTGYHTVDKYMLASDSDSGMRNYNDTFDMGLFTSKLQEVQFEMGETYSYTVTAKLATGDEIVVKSDSFVQGQA